MEHLAGVYDLVMVTLSGGPPPFAFKGRLTLSRDLPVWIGMGLLWSEWLVVAVALWALVLRVP